MMTTKTSNSLKSNPINHGAALPLDKENEFLEELAKLLTSSSEIQEILKDLEKKEISQFPEKSKYFNQFITGLNQMREQLVTVLEHTQKDQKKSRRGLPLLELYEFQTLTEYVEENLIFTPSTEFACTPVKDLYQAYLTFFYEKRYKGEASFEDFEKLVNIDKKNQPRGLTTKYQFTRALMWVIREKFNRDVKKIKTQHLVLQGVALKNPDKDILEDVVYDTWLKE